MSVPLSNTTEARPAAILDFEDLISPVSPAEFFDRYWGKTTLVLHRRDREYYGDLFTLADVDRCLITAGSSPTTVLQIVPPPSSHRESKLLTASGISKDRLYDAYLSGDTIRLIGAEKFWPPLALLLASLQETFNARWGTNVFLTPPESQAFSLHFDTVDVLVLQIAGSKRWRIWEPTYEFPMDFPLSELHTKRIMEKDEGKLTLREDFLLEAGDFFYMPRGYYHKAVAADDLSLHLTLTVHPLYWLDIFKRAFELAALEDPRLRQALPPGIAASQKIQESIFLKLYDMLHQFNERVSPEMALRSLMDEYVEARTFPGDGHFAALASLPAVSPASLVERRRGLACIVETSEDKSAIRFGPNRVQGPAAIAPALEFLRDRRRFKVADLPGDLSNESKVVLVRRLIREGLLSPVTE
ncbi:MAG: JmjC domain-containing protein [Thermoanaerobaculia bacterium]